MTKFGRIDKTIAAEDPNTPVGPGQQNILKDPKLVYNDPNFGWVTPASNRKVSGLDKFNSILPTLIMAGASIGLGGIGLGAIPSWASGLTKGAGFLGGLTGSGSAASGAAIAPVQTAVGGVSSPQRVGGIGRTLNPKTIQMMQWLKTQRG
jgi:hypothetical protein